MSNETLSLRRNGLWATLLIGLPALAAYWFVVTALVAQWIDDSNYAHGLFISPMALFLAWRRREQLACIAARPSAAGIAVMVAAGLVYIVGVAGAELFTMRVSMVLMGAGLVLALQGRERTRALLLPIAFLFLMVPLPYVIYYKLTLPLQLQSSALTAKVLSAVGMPVVREGNVIRLEHYTLEVVTACSGLRSIMTLGAMAVFLTDFMQTGVLGRVLLVLLVVPIAVLANTVRLLATAVLSAVSGPEAAEGFLHGFSGVAVFLVGLIALVLCGKVLEWVFARSS